MYAIRSYYDHQAGTLRQLAARERAPLGRDLVEADRALVEELLRQHYEAVV